MAATRKPDLKQTLVPVDVAQDAPIYLDTKTLSRRTPFSVSRLESWRADGDGPPFHRLPGNARKVVYKWSEVVAWIEGGKIK